MDKQELIAQLARQLEPIAFSARDAAAQEARDRAAPDKKARKRAQRTSSPRSPRSPPRSGGGAPSRRSPRIDGLARTYADLHRDGLAACPRSGSESAGPPPTASTFPRAFTSWRWRSPTRCRAPIREREELRVASRLSFGVTM